VAHRIQAEDLVPVEVLGLDLVHLVVPEVGSHQGHLEEGSGSWGESHLVEGTAVRSEGSEEERRLVGKEEMAYRDLQVEEGHLAFQTVEVACLSELVYVGRVQENRSRTWKSSREWRWKAASAGRGL
jgi:hypothetical protein